MSNIQELKLKQKKKDKQQTKKELNASQRVAIRALQRQLQILKLKELLLLIGFTVGAALLRVPMQVVPSAEPLLFFAVLSGWLFGKNKGFAVGAGSLYISNYFMFGGHGPWTLFQAVGFGIAGWLGGLLRKKASYPEVIIIVLTGTLIFEIIMNAATPFMLPTALSTTIFMAFALALPFTIVHLASNFVFALALPSAKRFVEKNGGFNEKDICVALLNKYNINTKSDWFKRFRKREIGAEQNSAWQSSSDN